MATFTILAKKQIQGTVTSASTTVPAGVTRVQIDGLLNSSDLQNVNNSIRFGIEQSQDGGFTWITLVVINWQGGQQDINGNFIAPNAAITVTPGLLIRAWVDVPVAMQLGATITTS